MTVKNLIAELQKVPADSTVFMGYDGNIVVTRAAEVEFIKGAQQIGECWWRVSPGFTVILCDK